MATKQRTKRPKTQAVPRVNRSISIYLPRPLEERIRRISFVERRPLTRQLQIAVETWVKQYDSGQVNGEGQ